MNQRESTVKAIFDHLVFKLWSPSGNLMLDAEEIMQVVEQVELDYEYAR